ncbi:MAG: thioesterase family protein [Polyangiales bacterium]
MSDENNSNDSFERATAVAAVGSDRFEANIPDGWQQGRGAFGGVVFGTLARALELTENSERPLRALTGEIPSPLGVGAALVQTRTMRRGKGLSSHVAEIVQGGESIARATGIFGDDRPVDLVEEMHWSKEPKPFEDSPVVPESALAARFAKHLEFRLVSRPPFSGGDEAIIRGWVRFRNAPSKIGAPEILAYADSYWPTLFSLAKAPRPAATVGFYLHVVPRAYDHNPLEPVFCENRGRAINGGYTLEERVVFNAKGEMLAFNTQSFVIIQ